MSANEKNLKPDDGSGEKKDWKSSLRSALRWNRKLIVLKLVIFFFQGGMTGFLPYLTLHMQQLGITVKEIAIIYAFLPIASLLGPPTSGIVADKFGKYKIVLVLNIVLTTILHCSLLYVPSRDRNPLVFNCGGEWDTSLTWESCDYCHGERNGTTQTLVIQNCKFLCDTPPLEPSICYHLGSNSSTCLPFNIGEKIEVNSSILSIKEGDTCSHEWYSLVHEGEAYQKLSCLSECSIECQVTGTPHCDHPDDPANSPNTFWIYFILRLVATFFLASSFTMLDATTLAVIKHHDGDFGKQRVLNMLGQATIPLLSGILVDYYSRSMGYSDYMPALYLGAALNLVSAALVYRLNFTVDKAGKSIFSDLRKLLTKPEIDMFLVMILILGSNWGFIESYLFVFLKQLNAPNYLLGLTLTVGCITGVPVMYICDKVVEKLGRHMVFIISFLSYAIRQFGYAYMTDPWLVFPFELLEVFTYQIMWVAAVTYCPILAPKGLLATMTGVAGAVHYSVGRGIGALLGGYLIAKFGLTLAFNFFGYVCVGSAGLYIIAYFTTLRKRQEIREKQLKEEKLRESAEEGKPMIEKNGKMPTVVCKSETEKSQVLS